MKRSITRWTMALATAGVLTLPVSSFARTAQDPQPQQPQQQQPPAQPEPRQPQPEPQPTPTPQQQTPAPQPSAATTQAQTDQALTPQDHVKKAQEAAKDIDASSIPSKSKSAFEDMKKHLANLDKIASGAATPTAAAETAKKGAESSKNEPMNWGTEAGAIDKAISEMVGTETAPSNPATPTPTGTSGKSTSIDDATRAKLMEVRSHITAYAAAMAGGSTPKTEAPAPKTEAAASPAAEPSPQPSMTPSSPAPQNPPAQSPSPSPAQPDPNAAAPAQPPAAQQPTAAAQSPAAQAQPQVDTEVAHKHLVAARETLAQLTQLPAAAQLSGEPRNQVSQLITNFNALITTQSNWRESYDKVNANLNTLLGPQMPTDEANAAPAANPGAPAPGAPPTPGTATPGAVGTAGTASVEIDPSIRAKLVELRKNLDEFKKAAGGAEK